MGFWMRGSKGGSRMIFKLPANPSPSWSSGRWDCRLELLRLGPDGVGVRGFRPLESSMLRRVRRPRSGVGGRGCGGSTSMLSSAGGGGGA